MQFLSCTHPELGIYVSVYFAIGAGEGMPQRPRHLDLAQPLIQRIAAMPMNSALAENVDILRATECRVASLEAAVKERESQLHSARQDVEQLQVQSP